MFSSDKWFGASAGFYPETIDQSLRFEDGDSPSLRRTPSSAGNRRTWTLSFWLKRANITGSTMWILGTTADSSANELNIIIQNEALTVGNNSTNILKSDNLLRDVTNFYHILIEFDSTQASASDRMKFYINGTETSYQTDNRSSQVSQNAQLGLNNTVIHSFGARSNNSGYTDGYFAEVNLIDGTALTPSSFGETKNGVWIPKEISGLTYGTNGFRLTFADSSSLGDDTSGNGNDFTSSGLASTDVVLDSPTNNFATLNNLIRPYEVTPAETVSDGNLNAYFNSSGVSGSYWSTFFLTSGKWYFEVNVIAIGGNADVGISNKPSNAGRGTYTSDARGNGYFYQKDGQKGIDNTFTSYGDTYTTGDIIGCAFDLDNNTITFYKNNSSQGQITGVTTTEDGYIPAIEGFNGTRLIANFGQDSSFAGNETAQGNKDGNGKGDFYYAPPSGYLALCSSNLPDTTISPNQDTQADDHFIATTYSGDSNNSTQISTGFQPDWVWIKNRTEGTSDGAGEHMLYDSTRGVHDDLNSNNTSAEDTNTNGLQEFGSTFFRPGSLTRTNETGDTYVAWNWKANGGTTSSNTDGDITSTVQANTDAGFSIVTYTGTGTQSDTVGHALGKKPAWVLVKSRSEAQNWHVYHQGLDSSAPHNYTIFLNATNARASSSSNYWGGTAPTTTVMGVGSDNSSNKSGTTYVMYCFAEVEGFSKFGSYTGNSSADGTFVYTGFRPAWVMTKSISVSSAWRINDGVRNPFNGVDANLYASANNAEDTGTVRMDFVSNGFKLKVSGGSHPNASTSYIYMAFAEQPFKFSNAR